MHNGLPRTYLLIAIGIAALLGVFVTESGVRAAECEGASALDCECPNISGCRNGFENALSITNRSGEMPFEGITCTEAGNTVCLRTGESLCAQVASFLNQNQSSCKNTCSPGTKVESMLGILCDGSKDCCLEAPSVSSGCLNIAGVTSACKGTVTAKDTDVSQSPYWTQKLKMSFCADGTSCAVARGTEFCKASAANEGLTGNYVCTKKGDCEKDIAEKAEILQGKLCLAGQLCCLSKGGEEPKEKAPVPKPKVLPDPLGGANIHSIIGNVIKTFAGIAGSIALIMFVYGGIMMITSGGAIGKEGKGAVINARKILINATIGIILIFAAYTFVAAIIDAILAE